MDEIRAMIDRFLPSDININLGDLVRHYHSIKPKKEIWPTHHNRRLASNMLKQICKLEGLTNNVTEDQPHYIILNKLGNSLHTVVYKQMIEMSVLNTTSIRLKKLLEKYRKLSNVKK